MCCDTCLVVGVVDGGGDGGGVGVFVLFYERVITQFVRTFCTM